MTKSVFTAIVFLIVFSLAGVAQEDLNHQNKNLSIDKRVDKLMQQMTLEEKTGQMCQYVAIEHIRATKKKMKGSVLIEDDQAGMYKGMSIEDLKQLVREGKVGSFLHVKDAKEANELQKLAQQSRLKIPLLIGIDAIHGHALIKGSTVFPTQLSLSSTWNNDLIYNVAKATAKEVRSTGMHWTFSPNVDVARDPRWGRTGETFGEDPFMVSQMGVAFTLGYQGNFGDENIIACAKHFVAGSEPLNGSNASTMDVSMHQLREIWFPSFKAQVDAGVYSFMAAHNELNGVPCHANKFLLTEILRNEWGFKGFVVSDWMDIERLYLTHKVAASPEEAVKMSVDAGMDMHMHGPDFLESLEKMVENGEMSEERINESCRRILKAKFLVGLFENPFCDVEASKKILFNSEHKQLALRAARESIVLLKNENKILPLKNSKRILVTGPNANNDRILGDWTLPQPEENIVTPFEGIKSVFANSEVEYFNSGESLRHPVNRINEAVQKAKDMDAVVVVVGSNSLRYDTEEKTSGENIDRANINLLGNQLELIKAIYEVNKNIVVVFVNSRPLAEPWIKENIPAVIEAWEPGAMGGTALAEILAGNTNPSGKLSVTIPYSVGQITSVYNHKPMHFFHKYIDEPVEPLWEFGFGLSYTEFNYNNFKLNKKEINNGEPIELSIDIENAGEMDGDEIVQLYIRDNYSTVTRPVKELKDYKRISLKAGETKTISFSIPYEKLGFYNIADKYIVEPGEFTIMVGNSSDDASLQKEIVNVLN